MIKKIHKRIREKGFTVLETLVAISVLLLAITGPLVFSQNSLRSSFEARDRITAFFLAQDVIEYIKNKRDQCGLDTLNDDSCSASSNIPWIEDVEGGLNRCEDSEGSTGGCAVDTVNNSISTCSSSNDACNLYLDPEDKTDFTHQSVGREFSRFRREVHINQLQNTGNTTESNEVEIVVVIEWGRHPDELDNRLVVQENIKNWIPGSPTE